MGTRFHSHDHSWLAQLHGRKLWYVHSGDAAEFAANEEHPVSDPSSGSSTESHDAHQEDACSYHKHPLKGAINMRHCVASPGDIIYIPISYEHATCNLDRWTIGAGWMGDVGDISMAHQAVLDNDEASLRASFAIKHLEESQPQHDMADEAHAPESAVHLAAFTGNVDMLKALEELGEDLHLNTEGSGSALHTAAGWGHVAAVEYLVNARMHPDMAQTGSESTPLHYAASVGHAAVTRWLLSREDSQQNEEAGSDRRLKDQQGTSALDYAATNGHEEIVELLMAGAAGKHMLKEVEDTTVADIAEQRGYKGMARRLREAREKQ